MGGFICPVIVGLAVGTVFWLSLALSVRWLYRRWRQTFDGMYDGDRYGSAIADQGDDWAPAPIPWPGNFIEKPTRNNETRPAWHSAVGVEIVTRGE